MLLVLFAGGLAGCRSGNGEKLGERIVPLGQSAPKGGGRYMVGQPYKVAGRWYRPHEDPSYDKVGTASWYGELFHGRRTANGEIYDMDRLSAAHPTLPLPSYVRVTNLNNGRNIIVRVNDRGPYAEDRVIDVSARSAEALGFRQRGTARVRVTYMGPAPLSGDDSYERRYLASQGGRHYAAASDVPRSDPAPVASIPQANPQRVAQGPAAAAPLRWQVSPSGVPLRQPDPAMQPARLAPPDAAPPLAQPVGDFLIQAGSFKVKENAERANSLLGAVGRVEIAPIAVGEDTYYRVRVGPFRDRAAAEEALGPVTAAGYGGARILAN